MKYTRALFLSGVAATGLLVSACGQSNTSPATIAAGDTATSAPVLPPVLPPMQPADFVQKVAISDMYEVQASQLAVRRAGNAQIRAFARQMVTDHTATTQQLRTIARDESGIRLPTAPDQAHQDQLTALQNATAANFDQLYVDQQTHAHENALHMLQDYSQNGTDAALKQFAADTVPKVQHHLDMVRALDRSGADEPPHNQ